eukprot:scaffold299279_cov39-Tisochrysis_lutea.AAC.6
MLAHKDKLTVWRRSIGSGILLQNSLLISSKSSIGGHGRASARPFASLGSRRAQAAARPSGTIAQIRRQSTSAGRDLTYTQNRGHN